MDEKLRRILSANNWTQIELSERLGVSQPTVSRWFSGSEPTGARRDQINELYEQAAGASHDIVPGQSMIKLVGYLGAGAVVEPDYEQIPPEGLDQIEVPFPLPAEMIAFKVRGDSMLPVYKEGAVIIVYKDQKKPLESFYGEEAAVLTNDGRRFIKTIMRGPVGVSLFSWNASPIEDVHLEWIGEIFAILPPAMLKKVGKQGGIQGQLKLQA
ncbi:LexA family transcriptional regulator [Phyllobacterium sp. 22229]|uniref:LexA family transcriptional regulator n=1 Tax=Phyllobacterium sp. 22229 TaxID=3453895 RepID=UPI003F84B32B